jgi:zinc protease
LRIGFEKAKQWGWRVPHALPKNASMTVLVQRIVRIALAFLLASGLVLPAVAQVAKPAIVTTSEQSWLYKGSDIPPDPAWTFGTLPNGVRYAVRRGRVPPGQVSIRVGIEAGALMERDSERGYAHFLEHLSFRGSKYVPDGEAKRAWQRLGATFGSDTNAVTTTTQTIYKLDLPGANRAGLEESVKILSGMMSGPTMTQAEVDAERRTVLAESRERSGPQVRVGDATTALFFAGQPLANRSPIGTVESLNAATSQSLRAFHDRWYRPERAIVVISGDGDPQLFEQLIKQYFSDWQGKGPRTPEPDFGKPVTGGPTSKVLAEPGMPMIISMATLRPWIQKNDTIAYNQGKLIDLVAIRLINRRLEQRARAGGSFLQAQAGQEDVSRSADGTFVQIVPLGEDWQAALRDVRAVIADALANPSSQVDITREANEFFSALQVGVETERAEAASKQADDILEAVNIRETVATAQVALDVFSGIKDGITPAAILDSTKRLFSGVGPRAILTTPKPAPTAEAQLVQALGAPVQALSSTLSNGAVSFKQLPSLGKPGIVTSRKPVSGLDIEMVTFANGVNLILFPTPAEAGKVYVNVSFGDGMKALPIDRQTPAWAGPAALIASGIGPFDQNALDRLTSARKINMGFEIGENAFVLRAQTRSADLTDQLRLMAAAITSPRFDAPPVLRARASFLTGYDTLDSSPQSVLSRDLGGLLHGGDFRWSTPNRDQIESLTPQAFRSFWEPLLKSGPIEVMVFGDVTAEDAIAATAASLGALKPRPARPVPPDRAGSKGPQPTKTPLVRTHRGPKDQAAAVLAWPIGGGMEGLFEARKLEILSSIFNDRLFDQLREGEGASYSPNADASWPLGLTSGGNFSVSSQVKPEGIDRFFALTKTIAGDLASKPVTADELARVINPLRETIARASSGNTFWMSQMMGASRDPRKIDALRSLLGDYLRITPAELQDAAKRWLVPDKAFMMVVKPE